MMTQATLIFPHQLFEKHPALDKKRPIYLVEEPHFFSLFSFHKQKLILHRASMKFYAQHLENNGYSVFYIDHAEAETLWKQLSHKKITEIHLCYVIDNHLDLTLKKEINKRGLILIEYETPMLLSDKAWLTKQFENKKHYSMANFYRAQRLRMKILIDEKNKPIGGKWSFDVENRKTLPPEVSVPKISVFKENEFVTQARLYVNTHFKNNPGNDHPFIYPTTFKQAHIFLDDFLAERLHDFGQYQDAIDQMHPFLFHSVLSSSLNCGLLTPDEVVEKTLAYAHKHKVPLASLEGFIRQIIGWREFMAGTYLVYGQLQRKKNFFNHKNKLPQSFWKGNTQIEPIDQTIKKVMKWAYAHHIERLMVLGNFMLLCEISPDDVYRWFMELFIDAYDWVMVPNIYGMSQYADGGHMTTKPYFSGSNYLKKMGNFKGGSWTSIWDSLYWRFMAKHAAFMAKNPRLRMTAFYLKRIKPEMLKIHIKTANQFINQFLNE